MKKTLLLCCLICIVFALSGCTNGFVKYYQGSTLQQIAAQYPAGEIAPPSEPIIRQIDISVSPKKYINDMWTEGYFILGQSDFYGPEGSHGTNEVLKQAKACGAHLVLWGAKYQSTRTGAMPVTTYTPGTTSTTYHTGSVGGVGFSGTSTTYNPGTVNTSYAPISVDRYDFFALYFYKFTPRVGILLDPLTDDHKRAYDTNGGALVSSVTKNSAAYNANIFAGDVLLEMNGAKIMKYDIDIPSGKVKFKVGRDGKIIERIVDVP